MNNELKGQKIPEHEEIRARVKKFFNTPARLGLRNGVTNKSLFMTVLEINPEQVSRMEQKYYWALIKGAICNVRHEILIISKGGRYFVAETQDEADHYKEFNDRNIRNCQRANIRADTWIKERKFLRLGKL